MSAEQSELERLRAENEAYRQRELADLRSALAAAQHEAKHWHSECLRLQQAAYAIHAQQQEHIATLKVEKEGLMRTRNASIN